MPRTTYRASFLIAVAMLLAVNARAQDPQSHSDHQGQLVPLTTQSNSAIPSVAQLTILNEKHKDVPEQKVRLLFETACRTVAEEFHADVRVARFPLTLVIGAENDAYSRNTFTGVTTLYLKEWSELKFTATVMVIAITNVSSDTEHYKYLLTRIFDRARKAAPVSVSELNKER